MAKKSTGSKKAAKKAPKKAAKKTLKKTVKKSVKKVAKKAVKKAAKKTVKKAVKKAVAMGMAAEGVPCIPREEAGPLVMGDAGSAVSVSTPLGTLFPDEDRRRQFCACVSERSGVDPSRFPCAVGTTLQDVIRAISC